MQGCRNCESQNVKDLGFVGEVAPFFLKRVLNLEVKTSQANHPLRLLARRILSVPQKFFARVYGSSAYLEMQVCQDCSFVQTKHVFSDDAISRLYRDYRSPSYDAERIAYEPTYASIAHEVGFGEQEVQARVRGLDTFLAGKLERDQDFTMLDFGGADGRFLPGLEGKKYVFEISNVSPREGVIRIQDETKLAKYSYVQVAHVLEHVPQPLALLRRISSFVKPSGYIYIEVPQDLTDSQILALSSAPFAQVSVHEHINVYCSGSIGKLAAAARLTSVAVESQKIDIGWTAVTIVRTLCRKNS